MKYSEAIKPISYLKANASKVIRDISDNHSTLIITHNGEAKVIVQDVRVYEKTQESLNLLKILAISGRNLKSGKYKELDKAFSDVRARISDYKKSLSEI